MSRIAFDARPISDTYHGIGRYAFRLLQALLAQAPQHEFLVFRGQGIDTRFDWRLIAAHPHVEILRAPWPLYWPQEQWLWPRLLARAGADLFHAPFFLAPFRAPCPVVLTLHDLIFERFPAYMPHSWARSYYRWLMKKGLGRANHVLAVSRATARDAASFYRLPPLTVVPEAPDPAFAPVTDAARLQRLRRRFHLERPFLLAVGARRPHKNLGLLVQAYAPLAGSLPHDLVLAGPADRRFPDEARQSVARLGLHNRVHFLEWVPEPDMPALFTLAELVAQPSLIEGFGLPLLEAMACGRPVVASATSALPEVVGEAGVLLDPTDSAAWTAALCSLLQDEPRRRRLGQAGRERAATFTWSQAARQVAAVYDEVLA